MKQPREISVALRLDGTVQLMSLQLLCIGRAMEIKQTAKHKEIHHKDILKHG